MQHYASHMKKHTSPARIMSLFLVPNLDERLFSVLTKKIHAYNSLAKLSEPLRQL